ncbi:unnamed protein product, partial [Brachionus calyciflorus]
REAKTLLEIIYNTCREGSIIYSDCWSSYNKIKEIKNFKHKTVNHSYNFIDPNSGACTNKIESFWHSCKQKNSRKCTAFQKCLPNDEEEFEFDSQSGSETNSEKEYDGLSDVDDNDDGNDECLNVEENDYFN